jgi:hypothetical protein
MECPDNEFSEHCTADMPSMDMAWHYWVQPKYAEQFKVLFEKWQKKIPEKEIVL